jgi:hypothetical protein
MFLLVFAGLLGGCIAFAVLLTPFGFLIALLGSQFTAGLAALGAGMFVALRSVEAPPLIEHDHMVESLRRLSEEGRRVDSRGEAGPEKKTA